jgi:hypothetical protein
MLGSRVMALPDEIVHEAGVLFHDTRVEDIDADAHAEFVVTRVLDRGTICSVRALLHHYGRDRIRRILVDGGIERVSKRTMPLWAVFLQLTPDECAPKRSPRPSSPFWTA